jgi:hypothetical protein
MAYLRKNFLNIMMLIWVIGMVLSVATARAEGGDERSCGPERQCVSLFPLERSGVIF